MPSDSMARYALIDGHQQFWCAVGREDLRGMRIEGQDGGRVAPLACQGDHAAHDLAMAGMHAIEVSDGDD